MTHLLQDEMERLYGRDSVNAMGRFTYNHCFTIIFSQPMIFNSSMHMPILNAHAHNISRVVIGLIFGQTSSTFILCEQ